jgi:hypothetical protein
MRRSIDLLGTVQTSTRTGAESIEKLKSALRGFAERLQMLGDGADELAAAKELDEVRLEATKLLGRAEKLAALKREVVGGHAGSVRGKKEGL